MKKIAVNSDRKATRNVEKRKVNLRLFSVTKNSVDSQTAAAQWSEGVTKPPWSSEQIEVNLNFLEGFGYILRRKIF